MLGLRSGCTCTPRRPETVTRSPRRIPDENDIHGCRGPLVLALPVSCLAHEAPTHDHAELVPIPAYDPPSGEASAVASLRAAEAFLASFDEATRAEIVFDLDARERAGWSNLPASSAPRAGISVGELSDDQRKLLFEFLASSLGEEGYRRVMEVMAAEAFLNKARSSSERRKIAPEYYWLSFYGTPSATTPWGWQFGGHHLGTEPVGGRRTASRLDVPELCRH